MQWNYFPFMKIFVIQFFNCLHYYSWRRNEKKFRFGCGARKAARSVKANHFSFDEINTCANVSFHMISFRVVFTWYFIARKEIAFLSKWLQWNNARSEFYFGVFRVNSYKKLTWHRNENVKFRPKWNPVELS